MIIMALDHTRDLLHTTALTQNPTDLNTTTPILFFTRWITHLCAPIFVFLAGTSVYLFSKRNSDQLSARNFLIKRGIWLIVLEFTLINFALWFDFRFRLLILQVIAAIGVGLIVIAFLLKVKPRIIAAIALVIIFGHNLLQFLPAPANPTLNFLLSLFFRPGLQQVSPGFMFFIAYPLIPWIAIMLLGFAYGKMFEQGKPMQGKSLLNLGLIFLGLFIVIRFINVYGDPNPWKIEGNTIFTILSFLNVTKYPPSLLFTLLFLGIMFVLLRYANKFPSWVQSILSVYGRVPLFYYLLHLYFIRLAVFIMVYMQGFEWKDLLFGPFQFGRPAEGSGISLRWVYVVWIAIVVLLYPLCRWYGKYKLKDSSPKWTRYL